MDTEFRDRIEIAPDMTMDHHACVTCGGEFTRPALQSRQSLRLILDAISLFNLGLSHAEVGKRLKKIRVETITQHQLARWVEALKFQAPYLHIREKIMSRISDPAQLIESVRLKKEEPRSFAFHRGKLHYLLDRREHERFLPISVILESASATFKPTRFEKRQASLFLQRCTRGLFDLDLKVDEKRNFASDSARLIGAAWESKKSSHFRDELQRYMLINDAVTIGVNTPLTLAKDDLEFFRRAHGFRVPTTLDSWTRFDAFSGFVDFLQVRNARVHLLKFAQPNAKRTSESDASYIQELSLLAMALSRRTGIRLFEMSCAWFDGRGYFEFHPLAAIQRLPHKRQHEIDRQAFVGADQMLHELFKKGA